MSKLLTDIELLEQGLVLGTREEAMQYYQAYKRYGTSQQHPVDAIFDVLSAETTPRKVYCINEPNYAYEIAREASNGYYYAILYHPSHCDIKVLAEAKNGETWFDTKEECINARIKKLEKDLEFEKNSKEQKLK